MKVIPPLTINDTTLTSSTISEPISPSAYAGGTTYALGNFVSVVADHLIYQSLVGSNLGNTPNISPTKWAIVGYLEPAWAGGTTYAVGDTVSYQHHIYQSLQASNTGNNPLTAILFWLDVGATNKYRCFDIGRNTASVTTSPFTVVITPGTRVNTCALLGLIADSIRIRVNSTSAGGLVYDKTFDLTTRIIGDWYDYFFAEFTFKDSLISFDLPPYTDMIVTIDITRATGNVECGSIVIGTAADLGRTQYNAENDTLNFSTIDRDEFGNSVLIPRRNVPKTTQIVWVDAGQVNKIRVIRDALNAVPAVWSGLDDSTAPYFEALVILGIYKKFTIDLAQSEIAILTIELEEV